MNNAQGPHELSVGRGRCEGQAEEGVALYFPPQGRLGQHRNARAFLDGLLDRLDIVELGNDLDLDFVPSEKPVRLTADGQPPIEADEALAGERGRVDSGLAACPAVSQALAGQARDYHQLASPRVGRQLASGVGK